MKIDEIGIWEAFTAVARYGNFSRAAAAMRLSIPQLSKRIAKLEDGIGARLFHRTTRVVSLTDEGKALLPRVQSVLTDLASLETHFENETTLSGVIRITCIPFVAHRLLIPVIREFTTIHPKIQIELDLSDGIANLIESNFDLAIRIQEPGDSNMVYRKLATNDLVACASPYYLKHCKAPLRTPEDLSLHNVLMLNVHRRCAFAGTAPTVKLSDVVKFRTVTCENGWFLTELAHNDAGILIRSIWDVQDALREGRLVQVLKKFPLPSYEHIYAVIPTRKLLAPRIRLFLNLVEQHAATWTAKKKDV